MPISRKEILGTFALVALGVACSDTVDGNDDSWKLDGEVPFLPKGVYDVELEILRDECSPSLQEISSHELWPPKKVSFRHGIDGFTFHVIELRNTWLVYLGYNVEDDGRPFSSMETMFDSQDPPFGCPIGRDEEYRLTIVMKILSDGVTETLVTRHWPDIGACLADLQDPWIPATACKESYKITHRLAEVCPDHCVMPLTYQTIEADGKQFASISPDQTFCRCD